MSRKTREQTGVRVLRAPATAAKTGLSIPTIHRKVRDGSFPAPIPISTQAVGWVEHEVDAWLEARIAERDGGGRAA